MTFTIRLRFCFSFSDGEFRIENFLHKWEDIKKKLLMTEMSCWTLSWRGNKLQSPLLRFAFFFILCKCEILACFRKIYTYLYINHESDMVHLGH